MKKHLLAGTAIVAAAMFATGGAIAQDKMKMMKPSISVNGYFETVVGGILDEDLESATQGENTSALDTRTDAEVYFNGKATLENGVKVSTHMQLESMDHHANANYGAGDPVDEYSISVSGSFGKIDRAVPPDRSRRQGRAAPAGRHRRAELGQAVGLAAAPDGAQAAPLRPGHRVVREHAAIAAVRADRLGVVLGDSPEGVHRPRPRIGAAQHRALQTPHRVATARGGAGHRPAGRSDPAVDDRSAPRRAVGRRGPGRARCRGRRRRFRRRPRATRRRSA